MLTRDNAASLQNRLLANLDIRSKNQRLHDYFDEVRKKAIHGHPHTFLQFGSYFALTGRKGWNRVEDGHNGNVFMVCNHPHVADRLLIFPELASQSPGMLTADWLRNNAVIPKGGAQLICYSAAEVREVLNLFELRQGVMPIKSLQLEPIVEEHMDSQYPIHILDTFRSAALQGSEFESVRNKANKWRDKSANKSASKFGDLAEVKIIELGKEPLQRLTGMMRACHHFWMANKHLYDKGSIESLGEFYEYLIAEVEKYPARFGGFVALYKDWPAGFTIWEADTDRKMAIGLAALTSYPMPGLSEFQMVEACRILSEQGVTRYNLGGSETKSLDDFKRKFKPVESLSLGSWEVKIIPFNQRSILETKCEAYTYEML